MASAAKLGLQRPSVRILRQVAPNRDTAQVPGRIRPDGVASNVARLAAARNSTGSRLVASPLPIAAELVAAGGSA